MLRIPRHLAHDCHLGLQQCPDDIVPRYGEAVVRKGDAHLRLVVGWDLEAEGRGGEAEAAKGVNAMGNDNEDGCPRVCRLP